MIIFGVFKPRLSVKYFVFTLKCQKQLIQLFYYGQYRENLSNFLFPIDLRKGPGSEKKSENFLLL